MPEIEAVLAEVGTLARLYKQRLTSHPSEFVKMAAQKDDIVWKSLFDLEVHSRVGYEASNRCFHTLCCACLQAELGLLCACPGFVHCVGMSPCLGLLLKFHLLSSWLLYVGNYV